IIPKRRARRKCWPRRRPAERSRCTCHCPPRGAMHAELPSAKSSAINGQPWYRELNRYHWFVLIVSALGWLFDTMDQQLFNLARGPAIGELKGGENVQLYGGLATMIFILGWATGGIVFGILGDRIGRA